LIFRADVNGEEETAAPSNWKDVGNESIFGRSSVTNFDDLDESDMKSVTVNRPSSSANKSVRFSAQTTIIGCVLFC
jgi:hypothetical protein